MSERVKVITKKPDVKRENSVSKARKLDFSPSLTLPIDHILFLHRTIGNQAVQRLFKSGVLQGKFKIGQPNDIYEQEADRVADMVMRMPDTVISGQSSVVRKENESVQTKPTTLGCPSCEEEELVQPKLLKITPLVQTSPSPLVGEGKSLPRTCFGGEGEATPNIETQINAMRGSGQPLPDVERSFMERRFGVDFSGVRIHTDNNAVQLSRELNAEAFTIGRDIFFNTGRYNTSSTKGNMLLAHELMHVLQDNKNSIELWTLEGHRTITRQALERDERFSRSAKHILVETTPTVDWNRPQVLQDMVSAWVDQESSLFLKVIKGISGFVAGLITGIFTPADQGYQIGEVRVSGPIVQSIGGGIGVRVHPELCEHGEALKETNRDCMNNHINEAVGLANRCRTVEGLVNLGYALHVAQDRASHGEGYTEGLAAVSPAVSHITLDTIATNSEGYKKAISDSKGAIDIFYNQLLEVKKDEIKTLVGAEDWEPPPMPLQVIGTLLSPSSPSLRLTMEIEPAWYREGGSPWEIPPAWYREGGSPWEIPPAWYREGSSPWEIEGDWYRENYVPALPLPLIQIEIPRLFGIFSLNWLILFD